MTKKRKRSTLTGATETPTWLWRRTTTLYVFLFLTLYVIDFHKLMNIFYSSQDGYYNFHLNSSGSHARAGTEGEEGQWHPGLGRQTCQGWTSWQEDRWGNWSSKHTHTHTPIKSKQNNEHTGKKLLKSLTNPHSCLLCPYQAFTAALQTQWSWILQLCCCIEAHLKENTAYYQVWNSDSC